MPVVIGLLTFIVLYMVFDNSSREDERACIDAGHTVSTDWSGLYNGCIEEGTKK